MSNQVEKLNELFNTTGWSATCEEAEVLLTGPDHPDYSVVYEKVKDSIDYINSNGEYD